MHIKPNMGSNLPTEIRKCVGIATMLDETVWMTFNGVKLIINPGMSPDQAFNEFLIEREKQGSGVQITEMEQPIRDAIIVRVNYETGELAEVVQTDEFKDEEFEQSRDLVLADLVGQLADIYEDSGVDLRAELAPWDEPDGDQE